MTKELLIKTENRVKELWENGDLPYLTHLCGGNEDWLVRYYHENVGPKDWIFCSHRTHYHALLYGIAPDDLIERIKRGLSMFVYSNRFVCSAIVGGTLAMASGRALSAQLRGTPEHIHCFLGDGATDQGCFWEAVRFAEGRDLPITYVVEDNGAQCGVSPEIRWGGRVPMMKAILDSPKVRYYRYQAVHPHAGCLSPDGTPTRPKLKWKPEPPSSLPAPP